DSLQIYASQIVDTLEYSTRFKNIYATRAKHYLEQFTNEPITVKGAACVVRWREKSLSRSEITASLTNYVKSAFTEPVASIEVKTCPEVTVPGADYIISWSLPRQTRGLLNFSATVNHNGKPVEHFTVIAMLKTYAKVMLLKTAKRRDETVTLLDVSLINSDVTYSNNALTDTLSLKEIITSRYIPAGTMLTTRNMKKIPAVKRGADVRVLVQCGSVGLDTRAKAKQSGYIGEIIKCENPRSKQTFSAKITDTNTVAINLEE
ncbi:MAG: flagellar basal body P-ring formation chaperone FlgA, partial [Candidatus Cloacimonetes bacterium]|nr:flagellar basal body P-ring formation chaperone FlgA [Candidatus Cloacimonadota bacterium]